MNQFIVISPATIIEIAADESIPITQTSGIVDTTANKFTLMSVESKIQLFDEFHLNEFIRMNQIKFC